MWGVGLCCQITSAPDLPREQVGTWLQQFPRSEHSRAAWIKCGPQGRVGRPAENWLPAWRAAWLGKCCSVLRKRTMRDCLQLLVATASTDTSLCWMAGHKPFNPI